MKTARSEYRDLDLLTNLQFGAYATALPQLDLDELHVWVLVKRRTPALQKLRGHLVPVTDPMVPRRGGLHPEVDRGGALPAESGVWVRQLRVPPPLSGTANPAVPATSSLTPGSDPTHAALTARGLLRQASTASSQSSRRMTTRCALSGPEPVEEQIVLLDGQAARQSFA